MLKKLTNKQMRSPMRIKKGAHKRIIALLILSLLLVTNVYFFGNNIKNLIVKNINVTTFNHSEDYQGASTCLTDTADVNCGGSKGGLMDEFTFDQ